MNRLLFLPVLLASSLAAQQEIVRYTFDSTDTMNVLNYATGPGAAPRFGTASWPEFFMYTPGRTGNALHSSTFGGASGRYVYTGWYGPHQGALTIAFFLKNYAANSVAEYSPITGQPGWSLASGGPAGPGLQLTGWGGPDLNASFGVPLCSMTGWNHFAIVVDPAAGNATWFRNGAPVSTTPIATPASLGTGSLLVGTDHVTWCGGLYHIDEFVMLGRAATPTEIATMATASAALVATIEHPSAATLAASSLPQVGNAGFALEVDGPANALFVLAAGSSYALLGMAPLPLDLGTALPAAAGQMLLVAPQVTAAGVLPKGEAAVPLPIPAQAPLLGFNLFAQAITLGANGVAASNALAIRVGQ
jgi:hypothetical protein